LTEKYRLPLDGKVKYIEEITGWMICTVERFASYRYLSPVPKVHVYWPGPLYARVATIGENDSSS
jgi:hypothetical protein